MKVCLNWESNKNDSGMNDTLQPLHHVAVAISEPRRTKYKAH